MTTEKQTCHSCDGSGVRANATCHYAPPPDGFVCVERCDDCRQFEDDLEAAKAWGVAAIWMADDEDPTNIQAIARPPREAMEADAPTHVETHSPAPWRIEEIGGEWQIKE